LNEEEVIDYNDLHSLAKSESNRIATSEAKQKEVDRLYLLDKYGDVLIHTSDKEYSAKTAIKNVRKELKTEFPNVKFSVKRRDCNVIDISWTDGPTSKMVEEISGKYEDHESDWSGDFRDYNPSVFNRLFGGAKYVFENRHMNDETEKVFDTWAAKQFEKDNTFDCYDPTNLAYKLFVHCEIPDSDFEITINEKTCGLNSPETFYYVKKK
jgi:hypothetical protein